jgi:hypothetical protein
MSTPLVPCLLASVLLAEPGTSESAERSAAIDVRSFRVAEGPDHGPAVYYQVVEEPDGNVIRASYKPGMESVTMGSEVPEPLRGKARHLRWRWRVRSFPPGGNDCMGPGDSAAAVFVTFKRGLKWYIIKYAWASAGRRLEWCDPRRNPFLARDTVILEAGGETGTWVSEDLDLPHEFRRHFARGEPDVEVPDFVGVGIMSDGDQTRSESSADYGGFEIGY